MSIVVDGFGGAIATGGWGGGAEQAVEEALVFPPAQELDTYGPMASPATVLIQLQTPAHVPTTMQTPRGCGGLLQTPASSGVLQTPMQEDDDV